MRIPLDTIQRGSWALLVLGILVATGVLLGGCHPGSKDVTETGIVVTTLIDETGLGTLKTYARPNSVVDVGDLLLSAKGDDASPREASATREIDPEIQDLILTTIDENMEALGYDRQTEDPPEGGPFPDLILIPVAQIQEGTAISGGPCYPGYYPPWWGWGWCYPPVVYQFAVGTLVFGLIDGSDLENQEDVTFKWTAGINGALSSSTSTNTRRLVDGIDQAFAQSPYLRVTAPAPSK